MVHCNAGTGTADRLPRKRIGRTETTTPQLNREAQAPNLIQPHSGGAQPEANLFLLSSNNREASRRRFSVRKDCRLHAVRHGVAAVHAALPIPTLACPKRWECPACLHRVVRICCRTAACLEGLRECLARTLRTMRDLRVAGTARTVFQLIRGRPPTNDTRSGTATTGNPQPRPCRHHLDTPRKR